MNATGVAQAKDPAIKLFGTKIPVPDKQIPAKQESKDSCNEITKVEMEGTGEDCSGELDKSSSAQAKIESQPKVQVNEIQVASEAEKDQLENSEETNQEKAFKKPDRIIPCPRCNSMETKFCYFNNYNVNQPRHFCKNCQRYWTAGGTMRNVPIGAGRRKNKHLASHYRQILVSSDGIPISRMENSDSETHQHVSPTETATSSCPTGSGMVLKFGPEAPLCKSMEIALNIGDKKRCAEMTSVGSSENGEEPSSSGSSITASSNRINEKQEETIQKEYPTLPKSSNELTSPCPLQFQSVTPWVLPWNSGWGNVASVAAANNSSDQASVPNGNNPSHPQWCSGPVIAVPGICPPSIPLQFIPASYWSCIPVWAAGTGNVLSNGSNGCLSLSSTTSTSCCSGSCSPTLGKHSRDFNLQEEEKTERCIFTPKTLRIDDPNEPSKSPLWTTLGLKPDQKDGTSNVTKYEQTETEGPGKRLIPDRSYLCEAKPPALSCSNTWQEGS